MKNSTYHFIAAISSAFMIGIIAGTLIARKPIKKVETSKTVTIEHKTEQVQTHKDVQKDSTTAQQTITVVKYYSPAGKVRKSEFIEAKYGARVQTSIQTVSQKFDDSLNSSVSKNSIVETYQSNWAIILNYQEFFDSSFAIFHPTQIEFGIGYRLFGNLYGTIQTSTEFNHITCGLTLTF